MATVPSGTKFIGISADVNTSEKRSTLSNGYQEVYQISDFHNLNFKAGSVGPKVSFRKEKGSNPEKNKDVIIQGKLEITRGNNGGGIYNVATEGAYGNESPQNTYWSSQYLNPENTSWGPLWDIENRTFDTWKNAIRTPEGNPAPPQYVGMPVVMKYDNGYEPARYWLILFTEWGVGSFNQEGVFAYDRYEIYPSVHVNKENYDSSFVDVISDGVHITRANQGPLYNAVSEPYSEVGVSPMNTRWNSIYTDSRAGYSGFTDLSNVESRVYTDFALALDYNVGSNVLNTDLIMHDLTTDLYYKVRFEKWRSGGNGGGFYYIRTVIPQSEPVKFADGSVLNTAPKSSGPSVDANGNLIISDDINKIDVGNGESHLIDNFSGMLMVNDHYDGRVETWICGGGDGVLLGYTNVGAGACTSTLTMASNGYEWTNVDNLTGPFTFTVIKTRQGS